MSDRIPSYLIKDMLESIENILEYTAGMDFEAFNTDKKTKDAVLRNLEVLGEAANRLPSLIKQQYTEVEWNKIIRSRHIVIHEYSSIDYEIVWRIVTHHLPLLKPSLEKILNTL